LEGNALFGQWTWSKKGISPKNKDKNKTHKVLQFQILKASVRAYKNNLNTHNAYKEFRETRAQIREEKGQVNGLELTKYLKNYASIGEKYVSILESIIIKNSLMDFDNANLLPTKLKKGVAL
jgi:Bax protein